MKVDGSCFCGHVTFEAEIDPDIVIVCHCTACRQSTAAPYNAVTRIVDQSFRLTGGTLKKCKKVADSGGNRAIAFCPECGSGIYEENADDPAGFTGLRLGVINQADQLTPMLQVWMRSALPWVADLTGIPGKDTQGG